MKIGKILLWLGLVIFGILIIWTTPVTLKNPIISNIVITTILIILELWILYSLFKGGDSRKRQYG